jgi:hypothetical protein
VRLFFFGPRMLGGLIRPGVSLSERDLAKIFGPGRTSRRDAAAGTITGGTAHDHGRRRLLISASSRVRVFVLR